MLFGKSLLTLLSHECDAIHKKWPGASGSPNSSLLPNMAALRVEACEYFINAPCIQSTMTIYVSCYMFMFAAVYYPS